MQIFIASSWIFINIGFERLPSGILRQQHHLKHRRITTRRLIPGYLNYSEPLTLQLSGTEGCATVSDHEGALAGYQC